MGACPRHSEFPAPAPPANAGAGRRWPMGAEKPQAGRRSRSMRFINLPLALRGKGSAMKVMLSGTL